MWIESHQELGRHPKTRKAARALSISRVTLVGHLQFLWWWSLDFAQDGNLSAYEDDELAEAAEWEGDPATFVAALVEAGFIERPTRELHDWHDYAGKLLEQRKANAEKQKRWRERNKTDTSPAHNPDITVTSPLRNGATVPNRTVPNLTEPNRTVPERETTREAPPPSRPLTPAPRRADARPALPSTDDLVEQLHSWAEAKGVRDILRDEVERFHDYCLSGKNGKPVVYADYAAACRKWITNPSFDHTPRNKSPVPLRKSNEAAKFDVSISALQGVGGNRGAAHVSDQHGEDGGRFLRRIERG